MASNKPVLISPELHYQVKLEAAKKGQPISSFVEIAILKGMKEMNRPRRKEAVK